LRQTACILGKETEVRPGSHPRPLRGYKRGVQKTVLSKIGRFIEDRELIRPGDKVMAGISGGPDSVCLLFALQSLRERFGFELVAIHVNHGLRGAEAEEDQRFVEKLCREWEIPLSCVRCQVRERAEREKLTLEEAGRICRYEAFRTEAGKWGCNRIAVGHHGDDQAETMLFHLFRGTGLRGLAGMEPERDGLIRPLLCVERREILSWLSEEGLSWRLDSSNEEDLYTRNRIRHGILALAREQINERAVGHMMETAKELSELERYLKEETGKALTQCVQRKEQGVLILEASFQKLDPLLAGRVIRGCLAETGGLKDVERKHVELVRELFGRQTGRYLNLPGGRKAVRVYEGVYLEAGKPEPEAGRQEVCFSLKIPGTCRAGGSIWVFSLEKRQKDQLIPQKTYTKWFDYDKIENYPEIRRRRPGDYLEINQAHERKKLKAYLIDQKVPARERGELLMLADGSHIIWVPGMRISEGYKVTEDTRQILKVQIYGGEEDGREGPSNDSGGRGRCEDSGAGKEDQ
jgi:tRNA(Ile)-lysidine synthase